MSKLTVDDNLTKFLIFAATDKEREMIFTIHRDGSIEKGPGFTTDDAASQIFYDALETTGVRLSKLFIGDLEAENAALKKENAALKKDAVIAEKYGLSQAAEICRDAAMVHPIEGYELGYNDACRDNYNAILKVKDKP